jgi:hypothetical protein
MIKIEHINKIILATSSSCSTEVFAARELQKYLKIITGRKLPVIKTDLPTFELENVFVLRVDHEIMSEENDEFILKTIALRKKVEITGCNPRSLLYGIYAFLKKVCNFEWTSPGEFGEITNTGKDIFIDDFQVREKAMLKYRGFYVDSAQYSINISNIEEIVDWMAKNYGNYILISKMFYEEIKKPLLKALDLRGLILEVGHHGFNCYVDPQKYFPKKPEWFSEINGKRTPGVLFANMIHDSQLCSSNREVADCYAKSFVDFWEKNPRIDILGVIPNDGFGWCECKNCMKLEPDTDALPLLGNAESLTSKEGWKLGSGRYHHFVNEISKRVLPKMPKTKKIAFWAYAGVIMPTPKILDLPENTILSIALYERWYNQYLDAYPENNTSDNPNSKLLEILRQWREQFAGEINIYEYYAKYCWQSLPKWIPDLIRRETRFFKRSNIQGLLSMIEKDNAILYEINYMAQLSMSWSSQWSSESFVDAYSQKLFGKMANPVAEKIKLVISTMEPYAKLGPPYPVQLTPGAINTFINLEKDFNILANQGGKPGELPEKSMVKLRKWAKNMKLTYEHFALNELYFHLLSAINEKKFDSAIGILSKWKKAKEKFYKTYKNLDGSGVCISDDVWTIGFTQNLFELEDKLERYLESKEKENSQETVKRLRSWAC